MSDVCVSENYPEHEAPQHNFTLDNPSQSVSVYARIMHEHTKKQLHSATNSARRHSDSSAPDSSNESLSTVHSNDS